MFISIKLKYVRVRNGRSIGINFSREGKLGKEKKECIYLQTSFEDKRKENFEKGQAELERRRKALLEIQRKEQEERERKEREEAEKQEKIRQVDRNDY